MLLRHAVPCDIKIMQNKIDYTAFEKVKKELNSWFAKKISEIKKPIKRIEFISAEYDMGEKIGIGISVELAD